MTEIVWRIRAGDTYPPFVATIQENGAPRDVSGATVTLNARRRRGTKTAIVAGGVASFVTDGTDGLITYSFTSLQTEKPALIDIEIEVNFGDGSVGTWPSEGYYPGEIVQPIN